MSKKAVLKIILDIAITVLLLLLNTDVKLHNKSDQDSS